MKRIYNLTKRIFFSQFTRKLAVVLLIFLLVENIVGYWTSKLAEEHVQKNDPRKLQNRSETTFYFAPFELRRGMAISRVEIIAHLKEIAYLESPENLPASFSSDGNSLRINSRLPQIFPNAVLVFEKNHLTKISVENQTVEKIQVEPLQMENAVVFVNESSLDEGLRTRRIILQPETVPPLVIDAVISTEDKKFFDHQGVNWLSVMLRPILSAGGQGGSSITQQLIKNNIVAGAKNEFWQTGNQVFDDYFKTPERKIAEFSMGLAVEKMLTKPEILSSYLSMNYMGNIGSVQLQGVAAAAQEFFDMSLFDISDENDPADLAKAATMAGMIQAPVFYLKYVRNGEKCSENDKKCLNLLNRRNDVLDLMNANFPDKYPSVLIEKAKVAPLGFVFASQKRRERPIEADSRSFIKFAMERENLPSELQKLRGEEGETRVFTSLDTRLQRDAVEVIKQFQQKLQPKVEAETRRQKLENPEKFEQALQKCLEKNNSDAKKCENLFQLQISLAAIDANSGEILAFSGGIDADARRSPGSLVKSFFYLKAIESGILNGQPFTAATFIDKSRDKSLLVEHCAEDENLGGSGTARTQLANSWNIGACLAAQSANIPSEFVGNLTNSSPERKLIAALGGTKGSETSLLNIIRAYTVFANNGRLINPTAYKSAFQAEKNIAFLRPQSSVSLNAEATFITSDLMKSVIENGTAANFRSLANLPKETRFIGKTGSGMVADLWFVGLTPRIVIAVWVGMAENLPQLKLKKGFSGGGVAAPIAAQFMKAVGKHRPDLLQGEFFQPETIVKRRIDGKRGCLISKGGTEELFIEGRTPLPCR
jgi:membrane peptidoglycan carboxypeptidase